MGSCLFPAQVMLVSFGQKCALWHLRERIGRVETPSSNPRWVFTNPYRFRRASPARQDVFLPHASNESRIEEATWVKGTGLMFRKITSLIVATSVLLLLQFADCYAMSLD